MFAKQETIDTLSQMFTASTATGPRRKAIAWETFMSAMADIGFSAKQGAGSAVDFEVGDDQKPKIGSINLILSLRLTVCVSVNGKA